MARNGLYGRYWYKSQTCSAKYFKPKLRPAPTVPALTEFPVQRDGRLPHHRLPSARPAQGAQQHAFPHRSEEHTSEPQSPDHLVCRLLLEKKKTYGRTHIRPTSNIPNKCLHLSTSA